MLIAVILAMMLITIEPQSGTRPEQASIRRVFAKLVFSINKGARLDPTDWRILTRHADLVFGLDGHGYEFPGYLGRFRAAKPETPVYAFLTAMAIQRVDDSDDRFRRLDRHEDAFLHCADPASLKVIPLGRGARLFWVRDVRNSPSKGFANVIGISEYVIETSATKDGPWTASGSPIAESGRTYYQATIPSGAAAWYRLRSRFKDSGELGLFSWPTRPDTSPTGVAYVQFNGDMTFRVGMWGTGPENPGDMVLEWGNQGRWSLPTKASTKITTADGLTEYVGTVVNLPRRGAWVARVRDQKSGTTSMTVDPARRNNRIVDRNMAHLFKPDDEHVLAMFHRRIAEMQKLKLTGLRLDFVLDSYPTWYVAAVPAGEDAAYADIKPRVTALLKTLKKSHPWCKLWINGISVPSSIAGIADYMKIVDGADCEFIGWSNAADTSPFRDADMLDGVISVAHKSDRPVACYVLAAATNAEARLTSFARYWLVYRDNVYYQFMSSDNHQSVDYLPEFDLDMGEPDRGRLESRRDLIEGRVYRRTFAKGQAIYNPGTSAVTVGLGGPYYLVGLSGGHSPKQGGAGTVQFDGPRTEVVVPPMRGVIVVKERTLGR